MEAAPGRILVKFGAEGVMCAALPELGLGIALKCDDGAGRGAEVMMSAVLARLLVHDGALAGRLAEMARPPVAEPQGRGGRRAAPCRCIDEIAACDGCPPQPGPR